jgi:hypothetical protein
VPRGYIFDPTKNSSLITQGVDEEKGVLLTPVREQDKRCVYTFAKWEPEFTDGSRFIDETAVREFKA